jgi:hypothetical protein
MTDKGPQKATPGHRHFIEAIVFITHTLKEPKRPDLARALYQGVLPAFYSAHRMLSGPLHSGS